MLSSWPPPEVREIYIGYLFEVLQGFLHHTTPPQDWHHIHNSMLKLQRENFTDELTE